MPATASPIFDADEIEQLRHALADYTDESVRDLLGLPGWAALSRGDLSGVARVVHRRDSHGPATLVRLFLLGEPVNVGEARRALAPLSIDAAVRAGLITESAAAIGAAVEIRPYGEQPDVLPGTAPPSPTVAPWWVISDFGADVRPGPLAPDHVLGIGAASLTLAQSTPRAHVGSALDIGTGCGVQALHLSGHCDAVTATDVSRRALQLAATTAALSGCTWDLRRGSLLEPVAQQRFDLIVANPPFVVSAGAVGHEYRDSGLVGDGVCRELVTGLPGRLNPGGCAQLLANWVLDADEPWDARVSGWLAGRGCDAWIWQREVADPGEYVVMWLRDAGETAGTPRWRALYDGWLDWFAQAGVLGVGMGLITMWRSDAETVSVVCEDVPQAVAQPCSPHIADWVDRRRWVDRTSADDLLAARLSVAPGVVRTREDLLDAGVWRTASGSLRQSFGMRWQVEVDDAVAAVVAACDGRTPLTVAFGLLASSLAVDAGAVAAALDPVLRDLITRGFLDPEPAGRAGEPR